LIYLDSCVLIYAFESDPVFGARARAALADAPGDRLAISPLVKFECLVGPLRSGNLVLRRYYEEGLKQFAQLSMPEEVYLLGAELRARFGLKAPDALHLATAQHHHCEALWTTDLRLHKAAHGLAHDVIHPER
jgi:predicted nucleic acid-binding protein